VRLHAILPNLEDSCAGFRFRFHSERTIGANSRFPCALPLEQWQQQYSDFGNERQTVSEGRRLGKQDTDIS
jgi:hypothetical protein